MVYAGFEGGKTAEKEAEKRRILDAEGQLFTEANEGNEERGFSTAFGYCKVYFQRSSQREQRMVNHGWSGFHGWIYIFTSRSHGQNHGWTES